MFNKTNKHRADELPENVRQNIKDFYRYHNPDSKVIIDALIYCTVASLLLLISLSLLGFYNKDNGLTVFLLFVPCFVLGLVGLQRSKQNIKPLLSVIKEDYSWIFGKVSAKGIERRVGIDRSFEQHYMLNIDGIECEVINYDDYASASVGDEFIVIILSEEHRYALSKHCII